MTVHKEIRQPEGDDKVKEWTDSFGKNHLFEFNILNTGSWISVGMPWAANNLDS